MDSSECSNDLDKSWDHPWTTDEMRQNKNDWSLAADAGLLKHLQQFSDNLTGQSYKIEESLNSLSMELNGTLAIIDNITNASLALANTQFIESRVSEDDVETKQVQDIENQKENNEGIQKEDLITGVSEIKEGLNIMDELFQRLEVDASDSEDEGELPTTSIVLKPNDPYQQRLLPYVIGSEKWEASTRVGLELSSSDDEPQEGDDASLSQDHDDNQQIPMSTNNADKSLSPSCPSSPSLSSDHNQHDSMVKQYSGLSSRTDKLEARSQDTLNSFSEIATPTVIQSKEANSSKAAPSFAEELAKRLGNVTDKQESIYQTSINQSKDDLFASDDGAIFGAKSDNSFDNIDDIFEKNVSSSLWKDKPIKVTKTNILPPSLDVPPPMNAEVDEPKSAFDDLYGDADSENSDNIFAPKSSTKTRSPSITVSNDQRESEAVIENKLLKIVDSDKASHIVTSTPETYDNGDNLFGDGNEDDDEDIFGTSVKSQNRATNRSPELTRNANIRKPPGLAITQNDLFSSNLGHRLFQRETLWKYSDSTDTEPSMQNEEARVNEPMMPGSSQQQRDTSSQNKSEPSSIVAGNADRSASNVDDSDSSGISIRPNSINNTSTYGVDFQPQSESTRLRSEEIYREGVTGDSLFGARSRQPNITNSINNSSYPSSEDRISRPLDSYPEEDFDRDDVFGTSSLLKADSKSKSKLTSSDDLFSNISSGSRLQKSSDLLATTVPQYTEKFASGHNRGLFDEDIDIFGTGDAPDVDIFGEGFKASLKPKETKKLSLKFQESANTSLAKKTPDLFFATTSDPIESAVSQSSLTKSIFKSDSIFDDSEDDDDDALFGSSFLKSDRKSITMPTSEDDGKLFADSSKSSDPVVANPPKKDSTTVASRVDEAKKGILKSEQKRDSEVVIEKKLPSYRTGGLFDNLDDDDDDSLFESKKTNVPKETSIVTKENTKSSTESAAVKEKLDDSIFKLNSGKIEGLLKDQSLPDERRIDDNEFEPSKESVSDTEKSVNKKPSVFSPEKMNSEMLSRRIAKSEETEEEISSTDGAKISKSRKSSEITGESTKREPPKSLSIRLPMPLPNDDSTQAPRRAVSGKIKNLMGKMGDFKILSPTDTPPLWRKPDEKSDTDEKPIDSRDSEDGSLFSVPSAQSPTVITNDTESSDIFTEALKEPAPSSPLDDSGNSETAVSFDVPAQVETLAVTASKSRAKIRAKRRPQSRHARQSALRKSGIDFDTVDTSEPEGTESVSNDLVRSSVDQILAVTDDSTDASKRSTDFDRLSAPHTETGRNATDKTTESSSSLAPDDRSEMSLSKGSSISMNKNTLLSPSTDEEDLFDVPPDLPEDPPKEDTLFGRAPILSPIDGSLISKHSRIKDKFTDNHTRGTTDKVNDVVKSKEVNKPLKEPSKERSSGVSDSTESTGKSKSNNDNAEDTDKYKATGLNTQKPTDPLRDSNHDPLKDPSQLFAFVTKTPSPEKGQNLLFKEDDSLFTQVAKKSAEETKTAFKKPVLDLFADDSSGDLFSGALVKPPKISMKSTKSRSLFNDVDADEDGANDLFGSVSRGKTVTEKVETIDDTVSSKSSETSGKPSSSRSSILADDTEDDLFVDAIDKTFTPDPESNLLDDPEDRLFPETKKVAKDAKLKDIFGDQSSGEDNIFATKKTIGTGKPGTSTSIFSSNTDDDDDDDINDIFGKKISTKTTKVEPIENRTTVKKPVTRDLKKTAEKIVEDPLSMLQDD